MLGIWSLFVSCFLYLEIVRSFSLVPPPAAPDRYMKGQMICRLRGLEPSSELVSSTATSELFVNAPDVRFALPTSASHCVADQKM